MDYKGHGTLCLGDSLQLDLQLNGIGRESMHACIVEGRTTRPRPHKGDSLLHTSTPVSRDGASVIGILVEEAGPFVEAPPSSMRAARRGADHPRANRSGGGDGGDSNPHQSWSRWHGRRRRRQTSCEQGAAVVELLPRARPRVFWSDASVWIWREEPQPSVTLLRG